MAIIGDSTANALYPGFEKVFEERQMGVINLGNGTCAPFRGMRGTFDWNRDCDEINHKIYDFLLADSHIKFVIMGIAAWDVKNMRFDGLVDDAPLESKFAVLSKLIDQDVSALERTGKKVIVTYDSPHFSRDPRACIRRSVLQQPPPECTPSEEQLKLREPYLTEWKTMLGKRRDICIFEQSPRLKTNGRYHILNPDGLLIFRDDHHLSYFGSEYMAREFINSSCYRL
jgi:hypothetical protein